MELWIYFAVVAGKCSGMWSVWSVVKEMGLWLKILVFIWTNLIKTNHVSYNNKPLSGRSFLFLKIVHLCFCRKDKSLQIHQYVYCIHLIEVLTNFNYYMNCHLKWEPRRASAEPSALWKMVLDSTVSPRLPDYVPQTESEVQTFGSSPYVAEKEHLCSVKTENNVKVELQSVLTTASSLYVF